MTQTAPAVLAALPLGAAGLHAIALIILAVIARKRDAEPRPGIADILWSLPFIGLNAFLGIWIVLGLVEVTCGIATVAGYATLNLALGLGVLTRRAALRWTNELKAPGVHIMRTVRDVVILVIVACLSVWSLENAWNDQAASLPVQYFGVAVLIAFAAELALYLLGQRTGALAALVPAACAGFGIAQHFVLLFKGAAILPSDLLALGTAAAVSGGYTYILTRPIVLSLSAAACALFLLAFASPGTHPSPRVRWVNAAGNLLACCVLCGALVEVYANVSIEQALGFSYDRWWPVSTYQAFGFIPSFTAVAQDLPIDEPQDYSDDQARELQDELVDVWNTGAGGASSYAEAQAQFSQEKPAVVAIMNETFSDLSLFDALRDAGYAGPQFFKSIPDALERGQLVASVHGGGTANTEFEFLTGNTTAFVGTGKYPYQLYNLAGIDNLARQFSEQGYDTCAIHPQPGGNWNRSTVYREMGFDEFLTIEDFAGAPGYHSGVTDRSTYDKILERLRTDEDPQFIFDVTMQNHGGYGPGTVPAEDLPAYAPAGVADPNLLSEVNTYLACIERSDADLAYFIDELRQLDRPVVLVFFGDHQPTPTAQLNDVLYTGETELDHAWRTFESSYLIWANYDVAGTEQTSAAGEIDARALSAHALELVGAPLSDYQKATLASRSDVPTLSLIGYRGADGLRYALDATGPYAHAVDALERIQYLNFARKLQ